MKIKKIAIREKNLRIQGLPDLQGEDLQEKMDKVFGHMLYLTVTDKIKFEKKFNIRKPVELGERRGTSLKQYTGSSSISSSSSNSIHIPGFTEFPGRLLNTGKGHYYLKLAVR